VLEYGIQTKKYINSSSDTSMVIFMGKYTRGYWSTHEFERCARNNMFYPVCATYGRFCYIRN